MNYSKPALSFEKQADLLLARGLMTDRRIYAVLSLLRSLLRDVAPSSRWPARLDALLAKYPVMPLAPMGFPSNWKATRLWAASPTT